MGGGAVAVVAGIWVVVLALSVGVGAWLVPWILRHTEPEPRIRAEAMAVLRGGTWIGVLERLAVTGTILAGYPSGVAIVVAVKGLGRYPELKEHPVASERFVVGTLASLAWAALLGLLGRVLIAVLFTGRDPVEMLL
jgi:asparagine N-glycosylation enzyme membrane subunit Stt3